MNETIISSKETTKNLVFIFHGYGANKEDMWREAEAFSTVLPYAEIHVPDGFEQCGWAGGYRWFPLENNDVDQWGKCLQEAESKIIGYIDQIKDEKNLQYSDIVLAGFSQGAMVALSLGVFYGMKAAISFSGLILSPERYLGKKSSTKVLLTHGYMDEVLHRDVLEMTKSAMQKSGIFTESALDENIGHSISDYLLNNAMDFLKSL